MRKITKKKKQKIEYLQIKNFMKNVKFFFYQCRKRAIENLIIEGIRQKINKYNKLLFIKILLFSKIECLKQNRVMIATRKKYQKKYMLNLLKKNVLLHNSELLCNIKFFFNFCFKIKIKIIKVQKYIFKQNFNKNMKKFGIHLIKLGIKQKKELLKKKDEYKNKLQIIRKKNFFKEIKNKITKKKYDKLIYLKHVKILYFAIGIINLKNKCDVELKIKSNIYKKEKTKFWFNTFKNRAIQNNKINNKKNIINKYLLNINFQKFLKNIKSNNSDYQKLFLLHNIQRKFYLKKYIEAIVLCHKINNIYKKVDEYHITKRKRSFFNIIIFMSLIIIINIK